MKKQTTRASESSQQKIVTDPALGKVNTLSSDPRSILAEYQKEGFQLRFVRHMSEGKEDSNVDTQSGKGWTVVEPKEGHASKGDALNRRPNQKYIKNNDTILMERRIEDGAAERAAAIEKATIKREHVPGLKNTYF